MEKLFSVKEAAGMLRVSRWTVFGWISQGKLAKVKAGSRTLVSEGALKKFLEGCNEDEQAAVAK